MSQLQVEIRRLMDKVESAPGWSVEKTSKGHYQIKGPHGALLFCSGTPSDWRAQTKILADLKRAGWPHGLPPKKIIEAPSAPQPTADAPGDKPIPPPVRPPPILDAPPPAPAPAPKTFGARLRALREAANLSQLDLAKLIDCDQSNINKIEHDGHAPTRQTFDALVLVFPELKGALDRSQLWNRPKRIVRAAVVQTPSPVVPPPPVTPVAPAATAQPATPPPPPPPLVSTDSSKLLRLGFVLAEAERDRRTWEAINNVLKLASDASISIDGLIALMREVRP